MDSLTDLERAAAYSLARLAGAARQALLRQLDYCYVVSRDVNPVGFMSTCKLDPQQHIEPVPSDTPRVISGVNAHIDGLEGVAGFAIFIRDGYLDAIEGFAYGDGFPDASNWTRVVHFTMHPP